MIAPPVPIATAAPTPSAAVPASAACVITISPGPSPASAIVMFQAGCAPIDASKPTLLMPRPGGTYEIHYTRFVEAP